MEIVIQACDINAESLIYFDKEISDGNTVKIIYANDSPPRILTSREESTEYFRELGFVL
jgi:hypothetical protein